MRDSIEHVSTKYLLLAENDDFIIPSGIKNIFSTMAQNNELISVGGRVGNFQIDGGSNKAYGICPISAMARTPLEDLLRKSFRDIRLPSLLATFLLLDSTTLCIKINKGDS